MRHAIFDKIFSPYTLVIVNFVIIAAAMTLGEGETFFKTGAIHIIAILFILLAFSRLFDPIFIADPVLMRFVWAAVASMLLFAFSHVVEFVGLMVLNLYSDAVFASVVNFYGLSMLCLAFGAETFLKFQDKKWRRDVRLTAVAAAALVLLTLVVFFFEDRISLEAESLITWLYALIILAIAIVTLNTLRKLRASISTFSSFVNDLMFAVVFVLLATIPNIFYEVFEKILGIKIEQIVYLHHFGFYAALSVMYLAFDRLSHMGGVFQDLREASAKTGSK